MREIARKIGLVFLVELFERWGWYSLGSGVFTLYLREKYHLSDGDSAMFFSVFYALIYFSPMMGGMLADRVGRRPLILAGILILGLAYYLMPINILAGMILVCVGNGCFKPNMTSLVGTLCGKRADLKDDMYSYFYMAINVGGLIGPAISAVYQERHDYNKVFISAYLPMVAAGILFMFLYKRIPEGPGVETQVKPVSMELQALKNKNLAWVCILGAWFWFAFHQGPTVLTFWASDYTNRGKTPTGWYAALNGVFILVFIPVMAKVFKMLKARGMEVKTATKMFLGFTLTSLSFVIMAMAAYLNPKGNASDWWLICCWWVLTMGEILLSPMGNSLFEQHSPAREKGKWLGFWFTSVMVGNLAGGLFGYVWQHTTKSHAFLILASLPAISALGMYIRRHSMNQAFSKVNNSARDGLLPPSTEDLLTIGLVSTTN